MRFKPATDKSDYLKFVTAIKMVICAIVGCPNTSKRAQGISFYRLSAVISHQGERARELSQKRQDLWLARIHRRDLGAEKYPNTRVCGLHFVSGKLLHGITIVPANVMVIL